ncbi:polyamine-modulated factor 1 isoform X3 [Castor canadensis]|uniref:Polyamine-modulated factor 1 isoform X3 n=2 Tax=Castor canadensis TaxID=51338 RepID=A0AC58KGC0_CASCN
MRVTSSRTTATIFSRYREASWKDTALQLDQMVFCLGVLFCFETESHSVVQAGLELASLLRLPPECWDYSYQRFTDCYKHFYQLQPEMTQRIYDKFISQLQTSVREEISEIKEEGNLEAVLNSLDKIVEEGKDHKEPAWRPSGIPEKDLCSAMAPYFLQQRDTLRRHVQKQEAKNKELADAVLAGRRQVEELQQQVQARQQAWQLQGLERWQQVEDWLSQSLRSPSVTGWS